MTALPSVRVLLIQTATSIYANCVRPATGMDLHLDLSVVLTAAGLPHYGHLLTSTIKDIIPRYWSMKGYHVTRRFGWDTHGLPIEYEIDKAFGISARDAVAQMGVGQYNAECRAIVMRYAIEWRSTIQRLGRWIDFDNDYKVRFLF